MTRLEQDVRKSFEDVSALALQMARGDLGPIMEYAALAREAVTGGGKLLFCGNGGSAADAQHLAAEYMVRLARDRSALPALALTTDTSTLTAVANDRGFDQVFARQVAGLGAPQDVLVLHSTSGESQNLLEAANAAQTVGMKTVALLAKGGGRLEERVNVAIVVPTDETQRAQEMQLAVGHMVCRFVEDSLFGEDG